MSLMRKAFFGLLLLIAAGCQTTAQKQDQQDSPIDISASIWNGDSQRGGQILVNVAVLNSSDQVIVVRSVDIGTARTTARKEIEPGQSAEVGVWLDPSDNNGSVSGVLTIAVSYDIGGVAKMKTFAYQPEPGRRH